MQNISHNCTHKCVSRVPVFWGATFQGDAISSGGGEELEKRRGGEVNLQMTLNRVKQFPQIN